MPFNFRENMAKLIYALIGSPHLSPTIERLNKILERQILIEIFSELDIEYVIDVGANEGQYVATLRRLGYRGMIFSFEPNVEVFHLMEKRFANDAKWRGFNYAIGSSEGELQLNIYEESSISSFLRGNAKLQNASRISRVEKVSVRRLDAVLPPLIPELGKKRIFLKSDTQGFDIEVVRGAEGIMNSIYGLQSEISVQPIYHNMPKYLESLSYYEGLGFILMDLWLVARATSGEVMEYDCVMKRIE